MQRRNAVLRMLFCCLFIIAVTVGISARGEASDAVNVILKNGSSSTIEVELIDQYGGNFTISLDSETSQNHALKVNSEIKVKGGATRKVSEDDEGEEIELVGN